MVCLGLDTSHRLSLTVETCFRPTIVWQRRAPSRLRIGSHGRQILPCSRPLPHVGRTMYMQHVPIDSSPLVTEYLSYAQPPYLLLCKLVGPQLSCSGNSIYEHISKVEVDCQRRHYPLQPACRIHLDITRDPFLSVRRRNSKLSGKKISRRSGRPLIGRETTGDTFRTKMNATLCHFFGDTSSQHSSQTFLRSGQYRAF